MTVKTVETEDLGEYDLLTAARYAGASKKSKNFDGEMWRLWRLRS